MCFRRDKSSSLRVQSESIIKLHNRKAILVIPALILLIASGCTSRADNTATAQAQPTLAPEVDAAVHAALTKSKATVPQFIAVIKNPSPKQSAFSVYAVVRADVKCHVRLIEKGSVRKLQMIFAAIEQRPKRHIV